MKKLFVAASAVLTILLSPSTHCMDQDKTENSHAKIKAIIEDLDKPQRTLMSTDPSPAYQDLTLLTHAIQKFESLDPETKQPETEGCNNSARPMQRTAATNTRKRYNYGPLSRHEIVEK